MLSRLHSSSGATAWPRPPTITHGQRQRGRQYLLAGATPATPGDLLMDMVTGHWKGQAVRALVQLGIPDLLSTASPTPLPDLAAAAGCDPGFLFRLLRYLAQFGLLTEGPSSHFSLTPMGELLRTDHPSQMRNMAICMVRQQMCNNGFGKLIVGAGELLAAAGAVSAGLTRCCCLQGDPAHYQPWAHLAEAVRTGEKAFNVFQPGMDAFDYYGLPANKEEDKTFNRMMSAFTALEGPIAASLHDFGSYRVVVDLGGSYGNLLMSIMDAHPGVERGIVFELPFVVDTVPPLPDKYAGKIEWVEGDFFKSVPVPADCYVMKSILHDWSNKECVAILTNIRQAMPPGAKLVNFDRVLPDEGNGFHPAKAMDINMLVMTSGRERTASEWHQVFGQAGFGIQEIVDNGRMAAIVATPTA